MALYITYRIAFNFHLCFASYLPKLDQNKLKHKNMRTRRGLCYPRLVEHDIKDHNNNTSIFFFMNNSTTKVSCPDVKRRRMEDHNTQYVNNISFNPPPCRSRKRSRKSPETGGAGADLFDVLPDDLVISIMSKLSASASCPSDFFNAFITCKRIKGLALQSAVLSKASQKTFSIKAKNWSESAHNFLRLCAESGNIEACYTLGMIRFYCLQQRGSGASLMAKAAIASHAQALYSLAIIQFNGSGGTKNDKDLRAGVALCARAAFLGHIDALRELGHCLQDGYGVRQNIAEGRRFLIQANARELSLSVSASVPALVNMQNGVSGCSLLSDFGCNVGVSELHVASKFLVEWFELVQRDRPGVLRMCSHEGCGRPETRRHEFRRCSVCGNVNYCSRACQALDWKLRHKGECRPVERWGAEEGEIEGAGHDGEVGT